MSGMIRTDLGKLPAVTSTFPAKAVTRRAPPGALAKTSAGRMDRHLVSLVDPESFEAEQYRVLRQMLESRRRADGLTVVAVSSPGVGEGKTTTAINLAGALAQSAGSRTLLIDADLRRPATHTLLGMNGEAGLSEAIADPILRLEQFVVRLPQNHLSVLVAGRCKGSPFEALGSSRFAELINEARASFDTVIIDTPPLLAVPDCRLIEPLVDGFLVIVAAHRTPRRLLAEALDLMQPSKLIGLVLNNDDRPLGGYYATYGKYYGSGSRNGGSKR